MSRLPYWILWLQLGMPFCVATAAFSVATAMKPEHVKSDMMHPILTGIILGVMGVFLFYPILAVNTAMLLGFLCRIKSKYVKAAILSADCFAAYSVVRTCYSNYLGFSGPVSITWAAAGAVVIGIALKFEPK